MICVTTRFRLKHCWTMLPMYLAYRGLRRDLAHTPGLIRFAFLVQSPVACCTLSIWESREALDTFANVPQHLQAVRRAKRWCAAIWSGYWRFEAVSSYANRWPGEGGQGQWPSMTRHPTVPWHQTELAAVEARGG
jgi:heme-degrading monooxygenase HmoA